MDRLIEILTEINDEYDYRAETELVSGRKLDSFDLVGLITEIRKEYGVSIPVKEITAENFDSAERILKLINRI